MIRINNDASVQCDIGYINLRKGLGKTHIEWTGNKETPQMEWRDKFQTHFEWKQVHSLHSLGAKNRPMSTTFILTHPGRLRAEKPHRADWTREKTGTAGVISVI